MKSKINIFWLLLITCLSLDPASELIVFTPSVAAQSLEDFQAQAEQLEIQGIKLIQAGNPQEGIQLWQQALQIYRQIQDQKNEGRLLNNFGKLFMQLEEYATAIEYLQPSLAMAMQLQNRENVVDISVDIGQCFRYLKKYDQAITYYLPALELAKQINAVDNAIVAVGGLGKIYEAQGQVDQAIQAYQEALNIAEQTGNSEFAIVALNSLGYLTYQQKQYSLSNRFYTKALNISRQTGDIKGQISATHFLGLNYYFSRNCAYAEAFFEWNHELAQKTNDIEDQLSALQNGGNAAYCQGKFDIALKKYQQSLALAQQRGDQSEIGQLIGNIGLVNVHLGNYEEAINYLKQDIEIARKLGNKLVEGQAHGSLGDAYYFQQNYPLALEFYQESLAIAKEVNYQRGEALMLMNIGRVLQLLERFPEAEKNLKASIRIQNLMEAESLETGEDTIAIFEFHRRSYRFLQDVLIKQNKIEEALTIAEAGRAKTFAQELGNKINKPIDNQTFNLNQIKQIAQQKNATLIEYSVIYDQNQELEKDVQIFIWLIKPNGEINFTQVPLEKSNSSLLDLIDNNRQMMGVRGRGGLVAQADPSLSYENSLQELYQLLIKPIEEFLPSEKDSEIIIIPQEELFFIPFVALQAQNNSYLIDKYTVQTAPSIQVLALTTQRRQEIKSNGKALVVGNPTMPTVYTTPREGKQLDSLPGTEKEAKEIATILNSKSLMGAEATKKNVIEKMKTANIIHLATHGLLDVNSEGLLNSKAAGYKGIGGAIALSPTDDDNGLLTVLEITELDLPTQLVVLSACDTGRGKISGDGVLGLSRSFLAAGASSVIVSLWSVPDAPTAQLMIEFYRQWQKTGDKAQALRQAMLSIKESHPHPRDWAAFTFIGETN
jgi:CHAT domain-containing protein/Tfp pilus assembly protein PilF